MFINNLYSMKTQCTFGYGVILRVKVHKVRLTRNAIQLVTLNTVI